MAPRLCGLGLKSKQCFGLEFGSGFRDLLEPDLDLPNPDPGA